MKKRYHNNMNMLSGSWSKVGRKISATVTSIPGTEEKVCTVKFGKIGLDHIESLKDITPEMVAFICDKCWMPEGFVAWRIVGSVQQMVYFKGRAAIISEFKLKRRHFNKRCLRDAISLFPNQDHKIIYSADVCSDNICA